MKDWIAQGTSIEQGLRREDSAQRSVSLPGGREDSLRRGVNHTPYPIPPLPYPISRHIPPYPAMVYPPWCTRHGVPAMVYRAVYTGQCIPGSVYQAVYTQESYIPGRLCTHLPTLGIYTTYPPWVYPSSHHTRTQCHRHGGIGAQREGALGSV